MHDSMLLCPRNCIALQVRQQLIVRGRGPCGANPTTRYTRLSAHSHAHSSQPTNLWHLLVRMSQLPTAHKLQSTQVHAHAT